MFNRATDPLKKLAIGPLRPDPKNVLTLGRFTMRNAISARVLEPNLPEKISLWLCYFLPNERERFEIACQLQVNEDKTSGIIDLVESLTIFSDDYINDAFKTQRGDAEIILTDDCSSRLFSNAMVSPGKIRQVRHLDDTHLIQSWDSFGHLIDLTLIKGQMTAAEGFVDYKNKDGVLCAGLQRGLHNFPQKIVPSDTDFPLDWTISFKDKTVEVLDAAYLTELISEISQLN